MTTTENTNLILSLKWKAFDKTALDIVDKLEQSLDHRVKELSDPDNNRRILAAFLAYRGAPFQVLLGSIHQKDRASVRAILEALKGEVLLSVDSTTYQFRDKYSFRTAKGRIKTLNQSHVDVTTNYGTTYSDGTTGEVAFPSIALMGFIKPSCVRIVAPYHHWDIFFNSCKSAPSKNWLKLEETETDRPQQHHDIMDSIVKFATQSGCQLVRYGKDSFLVGSANLAAFHIYNTITRLSGKYGQKPLLEITDSYQRKELSWGSTLS